MHLILTHEQADFDAVGALVAARLLDPEAHAVLPRRLNRNVRAFLTLYGDRLPLTPFDDLPRSGVARVTLVDTQALPSLKRLTGGTRVHVVDHHPAGPGIEADWSSHIADVGATTTLLVEALQESDVQLDPVEATLLLTGIYEDTGSLAFPGTTARDVRAAAWLLDQGGSLTLAGDFLNHPLTPGQKQLYDRLVAAAESMTVHGVSIVVACAEAPDLDDEISSLAHKLNDLFEPAGLFLLVGLDGHVQLVARSSSDSVDVGRICERFGGGGHGRAAAALVRGRSLEAVREALLTVLPGIVEPGQTVADIMSVAPQLLDPSMAVGEAAALMQRFGHEGFPVVEDGGVVGLLTRRAVDRAVAHNLADHPVRSVMDPGDLVAYPDQPVDQLQQAMIARDWGQVAVVDREHGGVVGIVTRTDLLRSRSGSEGRRPEVTEALERALGPTRGALLRLIAGEAEGQRAALYLVGGFVRDLLLGLPATDFDLVVEGDAVGLARRLANEYGGRVSSHRRFRTAKWRLNPGDRRLAAALPAPGGPGNSGPPHTLDFVSARAEFYAHPTALPSVQPGSIKLDLHRRDFSINTLAIRLDGTHYGRLLDPWGGGRDLAARQIRVLHSISFIDDPTRMLRAVRLEHRLGFTIEPRTLELLGQARPLLHRVSGERLRNEIDLILAEERMAEMMARLRDLGLLAAIHPDLTWDEWLEGRADAARRFQPEDEWRLEAVPTQADRFYLVWTVRLGAEKAAAVARRLRLPQATIRAVRSAALLFEERQAWASVATASRRTRRLEDHPEAALIGLWLALEGEPSARGMIEDHLARLRFVEPTVDGHELRRRGIPPGPVYARVLAGLRDAWIDGEVSSAAEEAALLERLLAAGPDDG